MVDEEAEVMVLLKGEMSFPSDLIDPNRAISLIDSSRHSF